MFTVVILPVIQQQQYQRSQIINQLIEQIIPVIPQQPTQRIRLINQVENNNNNNIDSKIPIP